MKSTVRVLLVVLLFALFVPGHFYAAAPFRGTVVDAQTQAPVEGAVVLAHWEVSTGGFADEEGCVSELAITEAVTDKEGRYAFPGWGPRYAGCLNFPYFRNSRSPRILVFKPGYELEVRQNQLSGDLDMDYYRRSEWNGKSIAIGRFQGTPQEYAEKFRALSFEIDDIGRICCRTAPWTRMPLMYAAIQQQALDFKAANVSRIGLLPRELPAEMQQKPCPSRTEIFNMCTIDGKLVYQSDPCPPAPPGVENHQEIRTSTPLEC